MREMSPRIERQSGRNRDRGVLRLRRGGRQRRWRPLSLPGVFRHRGERPSRRPPSSSLRTGCAGSTGSAPSQGPSDVDLAVPLDSLGFDPPSRAEGTRALTLYLAAAQRVRLRAPLEWSPAMSVASRVATTPRHPPPRHLRRRGIFTRSPGDLHTISTKPRETLKGRKAHSGVCRFPLLPPAR